MQRTRLIPVLLLDKGKLVKSIRFSRYRYIGDPINAVKIFNEKEVDELMLLDITATREQREPDLEYLNKVCTEAFMPVAYGGGVSSFEQIKKILSTGVEKVVINSAAYKSTDLITKAADTFGSQSIVVSIDVKKPLLSGYKCYYLNGSRNSGLHPLAMMQKMEAAGAGELLLNSIDRDGMMTGLDLKLLQEVVHVVNLPVVVCGGLKSLDDASHAMMMGASGVAGGSFFVFKGTHKAVLISYPKANELKSKMSQTL